MLSDEPRQALRRRERLRRRYVKEWNPGCAGEKEKEISPGQSQCVEKGEGGPFENGELTPW